MTDTMRESGEIGSEQMGRHLQVVSSSAISAEDFFYNPNVVPEDYQYATTVVERRDYKEPVMYREGYMSYETYTLSNGIYHHVLTGIPRDQKTDIPVDIGTAWFTDAEGHNEHTALKFMELGFPVRVIGSERMRVNEWRGPVSVIRGLRQALGIELAHSAHTMLEILRVSDVANPYLIRPGVSFHYGESRDAMIEPALQLLASGHQNPADNRTIVYADEVDPCCPEQVRFAPSELELARLKEEGKAIWSAGKRIVRSPVRRHYRKTFDFSLNSLVPQVATGPTLISGQAGEVADIMPDRRRSITLYLMSLANKADVWKEKYEDHDLVKIFDLTGAHMSIPDVLPLVLSRFEVIVDELSTNNNNYTGIDFEKVYANSLQAA